MIVFVLVIILAKFQSYILAFFTCLLSLIIFLKLAFHENISSYFFWKLYPFQTSNKKDKPEIVSYSYQYQ